MVFVDLDDGCRPVPGALPCFFSRGTDVTGVPLWLAEKELKDLASLPVKGALCIVEFFSDAADIRGRNGVAEELDRLGAAGAVFISDSVYHTSRAASTKIQRSPELTGLGAAVVGEEGAYLLARNRHHRFRLFIDADTFAHTAHNVVAVRPGTGEGRVIFGSHLDASPLTQGASDNASGVACVLELARRLRDVLPQWTFEFAAFDAEEYCINGDLPGGSGAYVKDHAGRNWRFFMNFDSLGIFFGEDVLHVGRPELLGGFDCVYPKLPIKNGGDDRSFDRAGVPTLWFNTHARFKDFHTPLDTVETLDIDRIVRCVEEAEKVLRQLC
jgi:Iap family predicted aminopeptidase